MAENLLQSPKLTASMRESPLYRVMGMGYTDRIVLIGHADNLTINEPLEVLSMQEAVNALGADAESPLLKGLMEAYFAGARDLWIVAAAPMSEYEPDLDLRDSSYYLQYSQRLEDTYAMLRRHAHAQIVIPIDAPFNSTIDFFGPLASLCYDVIDITGNIQIGILGTRGHIGQNDVDALASDYRLTAIDETGESGIGAASKYVSVFVGDAMFNLKEMPVAHTSSVAAAVAGTLSAMQLDRGVSNQIIPNAVRPSGIPLNKAQIKQLAEAKLNAIGQNTRGRRGAPFQTIVHTDNTLAPKGSDFWSLVQLRISYAISDTVRKLGTSGQMNVVTYGMFKYAVEQYMGGLMDSRTVRSYELDIQRHTWDRNKVMVDVAFTPYFGTRSVHVGIEVGPLEG